MRNTVKKGIDVNDLSDPAEDYLGFQDFALRGITEAKFKITSLDVDAVPVPMTGRAENKVVATLEGQNKALIISKGKRKALVALFGPPKNWIGQSFKLTADPNVKFKGKKCGGLVVGPAK
jgi:hypothetical protein